jgi:AraC-like DNA-binding protein
MMSDPAEIVLAAAMRGHSETRPAAVLDRHFQCIWSNTMPGGQIVNLAIVPDGCADLLWVDGRLIVAGPDVEVAVSPRSPASTAVGVRFRAGAASRWLGLPISEVVGSRVSLAEFWGERADDIAGKMNDASSSGERMRVFQEALSKIAPNIDPPSPDMRFVFHALMTESEGRGMATILDRLDVSPRTLRRRCHETFGYGPKTLQRILRFQRFLKLVGQTSTQSLAGLAFQAGYADQAHLTREVRRLSGLSPVGVIAQIARSGVAQGSFRDPPCQR